MEQLPRTGLHGNTIDPVQFGHFCTHAFRVFSQSPRTKLLRQLALRLSEIRKQVPDVEWLCSEVLSMPQAQAHTEDEVS